MHFKAIFFYTGRQRPLPPLLPPVNGYAQPDTIRMLTTFWAMPGTRDLL
jgi:hypothetical protein